MWQAPALVVAAQAFLFVVALNPSTPKWGRIAVMLAGLSAVAAASHSLAKQRYLEVIHSEAIMRCLTTLNLAGIYRQDLAPLWSSRIAVRQPSLRRGIFDLEALLGTTRYDNWIARTASFEVWLVAFCIFAAVDLLVIGVAIADLV